MADRVQHITGDQLFQCFAMVIKRLKNDRDQLDHSFNLDPDGNVERHVTHEDLYFIGKSLFWEMRNEAENLFGVDSPQYNVIDRFEDLDTTEDEE